MFVVEIGSAITTLLFLQALFGQGEASALFIGLISDLALVHGNFRKLFRGAGGGRGKAQADALRRMRTTTTAKKMNDGYLMVKGQKPSEDEYSQWPSTELHKGDLYFVQAGDIIPIDGEIAEGVASIDESAITGESAPVIRESGGTEAR